MLDVTFSSLSIDLQVNMDIASQVNSIFNARSSPFFSWLVSFDKVLVFFYRYANVNRSMCNSTVIIWLSRLSAFTVIAIIY